MNTLTYTLLARRQLTHDVFELDFSCEDFDSDVIAGKYTLFVLPSGVRRAYSIAGYFGSGVFRYIIKRLGPTDEFPLGGKGSQEICDLSIGSQVVGMLPLGHFVLSEGLKDRVFIGTGTGFAPLYFQLSALAEIKDSSYLTLVYGVRNREDQFYFEELSALKTSLVNLTIIPYVSRGEVEDIFPGTCFGRVTQYLASYPINLDREYYLCGSPAMVKEVRETLSKAGVESEKIKFEQF